VTDSSGIAQWARRGSLGCAWARVPGAHLRFRARVYREKRALRARSDTRVLGRRARRGGGCCCNGRGVRRGVGGCVGDVVRREGVRCAACGGCSVVDAGDGCAHGEGRGRAGAAPPHARPRPPPLPRPAHAARGGDLLTISPLRNGALRASIDRSHPPQRCRARRDSQADPQCPSF